MKQNLSVFIILPLLICYYSCKKNENGPSDPHPPVSDIITTENNRLSAAVTSQTTTAFISVLSPMKMERY